MNRATERELFLARYLRVLGTVLLMVHRGKVGPDVAAFVIDLLDPVGLPVAHGLRARYGRLEPEQMIRTALASTPRRRPVAVGPRMEPAAAALREPARPGHVRTLIVACTGAEVVHIDVMAFGPLVGLRLAEA